MGGNIRQEKKQGDERSCEETPQQDDQEAEAGICIEDGEGKRSKKEQ